jgi:DNA repair protein RadC
MSWSNISSPLHSPAATIMRRCQVSENVAGAIKIAQATAIRFLKSRVENQKVLGSWQALMDYLAVDMGFLPIERVRVLYVNAKNVLIRDDVLSEGSVDEAAVYVREVIRGAVECHATSLILVHNHPSGDPQPSQADIRMTREIVDAARPLGISVHDHVIVGQTKNYSLKQMGLI